MRIGAYHYEGTPGQVLSWLAKVQHSDEAAELEVQHHKSRGCMFGVAAAILGFVGFTVTVPAEQLIIGLIILAGGAVAFGFFLFHHWKQSDAGLKDLPDRKVAAINQFLKVINADTPSEGRVSFEVDFRPYQSGGELVENTGGGFFSSTKSLAYVHNWLTIQGTLSDGNAYQLSVTEKVKRKEKAKRKYTKVKQRRVGTVTLQLKLSPRRYGAPDALVRALRRLQPPDPLRVLRVEARGRRAVMVLRAPPAVTLKGRYGTNHTGQNYEITGDTLLRTMLWAYQGLTQMATAPRRPRRREPCRWSDVYDLKSLTEDPGFVDAFRRSVALESPPPVLRDAKIKITSRCNLRCQMCNYWKNKSEDALTTPQWIDVLDQLAEMSCRKVHFSGGEVFLRKDFMSIVEHGTSIGLKINMTTNGTLIDKATARRIVEAGVNSVSISLDGPTPRVHDRIRGQDGAFKKSVRTIRWLQRYSVQCNRKRPVKIRINFVMMNDNYRKLPAMTRLAAELGAVDINPMPVDEKGERVKRLTSHQIETYNREIAPEVLELRRSAGFPTPDHKVYPFGVTPRDIRFSKRGQYARGYFQKNTCLVPWLHMFIAWNGDVYLCCMTNRNMEALGNVRDEGVQGVFHGEAYQQIRQSFAQQRHLTPCQSCDLFPTENVKLNRLIQLGVRA